MVIVVFALPVLLLVAALLIDVTGVFLHKRSLQNRADAVSLAASQDLDRDTGTCTGTCVTKLNYYNHKNDENAPDLVPCLIDDQTNCFEAPYVDRDGNEHKGQIEVRLQDTYNLALGGVVGIGNPEISARAVSGATYSTITDVTTTPGSTEVTTIPGTPPQTIPSEGSVVFARSDAIDAIKVSAGNDKIFKFSGLQTNGCMDMGNQNPSSTVDHMDLGRYSAGTKDCSPTDHTWASTFTPNGVTGGWNASQTSPKPYPVDPEPVRQAIQAQCDATHHSFDSPPPMNQAFIDANPGGGVFCYTKPLNFSSGGNLTFDGFTFMAPKISITNSGTGLVIRAPGATPALGTAFFVTDNGNSFSMNQPARIEGRIFVPTGNAVINHGGSDPNAKYLGFIEAEKVVITGGSANFVGNGPGVGDPTVIPGTPDEVVTTTTPAVTTTTTTPGPTTYGLDE